MKKSTLPKKPRKASLDEVKITRNGNTALIEYADEGQRGVNLAIGPEIEGMTDSDILEKWNLTVEAMEFSVAENKWVAIEIPPGKPQIEHHRQSGQWIPRGGVLRCIITDDEECEGAAAIHIDDWEMTMEEFGKLLLAYNGWGMRVTFVPDDELDVEPNVEVREPEDED